MEFSNFHDLISKIKNMPLPGEESHHKMAPAARIQEIDKWKLTKKKPRKAAVISLFYPDTHDQTRLLLILRKTYNGVHSNQVGFPGGKVELSDRNIQETALRETWEEVGVKPQQIHLIKSITEIFIPPSNFMVHPFIGLSETTPKFVAQQTEVEQIIEVLFSDFMDDRLETTQTLSTSYAENITVPSFKFNDFVVWGATAMMLSEIKDLFKKTIES